MRLFVLLLALAVLAAAPGQPALVTLSIVGTSDLHGFALPGNGRGGLPLLAGYVNNLRASRAADGGAVLLVDSGDTFQGGIESDLSEGALVVDAYNAMGYAAEAVGNHDFDFGAVDSPLGRQLPGDLRGAIKARAAQARYPFLAANLIDAATGRHVEWPHIRPSVIVNAAGVKVGIAGVMTIDAPRSTIAANVQGLLVEPPAEAIAREATILRAAGAEIVLVAAHAGGRCERFDRAEDLSSCEADAEIFRVARSLPKGLVDAIAAGHTHAAIAHQVNGIAIIQPLSRGQAFGRVDLVFDRKARRITATRLFPPTVVTDPAQYEGRPVASDGAIVRAMAPALERVHRLQETPLGAWLERPLLRGGDPGSPLGNVFADALLDASPGADAAVLNGAMRGLRTDLPAGPLTFGRLYDVFPFDNRVARIRLSGGELRGWLSEESRQGRRGGLGLSGIEMQAVDDRIALRRRDGRPIEDDERLLIVTIGGPTLSGSVAIISSSGAEPQTDAPVVREVVEAWCRRHPRLPLTATPP